MQEHELRALLDAVRRGELNIETAVQRLKTEPIARLANATIDLHRSLRCGFPEVVFCQGKRPEWVVEIVRTLRNAGHDCLCTRVSPEVAAAVLQAFPDMEHNELAGTVRWLSGRREKLGMVAIVCAGTSDLPVAEEARVTAETLGTNVAMYVDVGVAGIHRLLQHATELASADAIVVVAGMEGALPSVVGGLVSCPVIGVPTSVGYGAHLMGLTPLHAMLTSCASNVTVVNVDSGFNGAFVASLIARRIGAVRKRVEELEQQCKANEGSPAQEDRRTGA